MKITDFIENDEIIVKPFTSVASIEEVLIAREYVVIKDSDDFIGLLTVKDFVRANHLLVVDCCSKKPGFSEDQELDEAIDLLAESGHEALPVFDGKGDYLGSVRYTNMLRKICSYSRKDIKITISNVVGDEHTELAKRRFIAEMMHNTKNPIQSICCSVDLLGQTQSKTEREILLNSILSSAQQIDGLFNDLAARYALYD